MDEAPETLHYKRSHFATQLPVDYLYSASHYWIAEQGGDLWRVGLTRFASRMLGEMVDHGFESEPESAVAPGQILGWVEGFKAISDVFCIAEGTYAGSNPALRDNIALIDKNPYGAGWLYAVRGAPDPNCMDVYAYRDLLDQTIERILAQQKNEEIQ
jgi:glycine cleavage system H protein